MPAAQPLSPTSRPSPGLPARSPTLCRWFSRYARRYVAKNFHALRLLNPPPPDYLDKPIIFYLNHPGWWDPLIGMLLSAHFFPQRAHYVPMEAQMLDRYRIFQKLGFFPVDLSSPRRGAQFLNVAQHLLNDPHHALWITAEGTFRDPRTRPIELMPGIAHLAARHRDLVLQPLAIEYAFWSERLPEALVNFGQPIPASQLPGTIHFIQPRLEHRLTDTLDQLATAAINRNPSAFHTILHGTAGTGGIYQLVERLRAWRNGTRFSPAHQASRDET